MGAGVAEMETFRDLSGRLLAELKALALPEAR
jgi:hypothetical protein